MIGIAREHCFIAPACQRSIRARMAVLVMASTPNQAPVIQVFGVANALRASTRSTSGSTWAATSDEIILYKEDIAHCPIEARGPDYVLLLGGDQFRGDA